MSASLERRADDLARSHARGVARNAGVPAGDRLDDEGGGPDSRQELERWSMTSYTRSVGCTMSGKE